MTQSVSPAERGANPRTIASRRRSGGHGSIIDALPPASRILAFALDPRGPEGVSSEVGAAIDEGVDWNELGRLATHERAARGLVALLAPHVERVPDHTMARLTRLGQLGVVQSHFLANRLRRFLRTMAEHRIPVMLLKGGALAHRLYPDMAERPMGDLDVLVRPNDAERAWELAQTTGWCRRRDVPDARHYIGHQHLAPLEDDQGAQTGLEIHTELFTRQAPFALPAAALWQRAEHALLFGEAVHVPDTADLLVHACLHFAWSHEMSFGVWRTLNDVRVLVDRAGVDWDALVVRARQARGATCCYWTLRLARDVAGAAIPAAPLAALAPRLPEGMRHRILHHFTAQAFSGGAQCPSVMLARSLWSLGISPRTQGHGASRPWHDTAEWTRDSGATAVRYAWVGAHGLLVARYAIMLLGGG